MKQQKLPEGYYDNLLIHPDWEVFIGGNSSVDNLEVYGFCTLQSASIARKVTIHPSGCLKLRNDASVKDITGSGGYVELFNNTCLETSDASSIIIRCNDDSSLTAVNAGHVIVQDNANAILGRVQNLTIFRGGTAYANEAVHATVSGDDATLNVRYADYVSASGNCHVNAGRTVIVHLYDSGPTITGDGFGLGSPRTIDVHRDIYSMEAVNHWPVDAVNPVDQALTGWTLDTGDFYSETPIWPTWEDALIFAKKYGFYPDAIRSLTVPVSKVRYKEGSWHVAD